MSESLGNFLLEMRRENKDQMETGIKTTYIGEWGELFALKYLEKLFERNNIKNDIVSHNDYHDEYDLDIYINGRSYKIEVKTSTAENYPHFAGIHFNNHFDFLFLVWFPNDEEVYFAILTKEEAKDVAKPMNEDREDEDNWQIYAPEYFEETNKNFLNRLSKFLGINKELEDLENDEKLELIEKAKEQIIKEHKDAVRKDFNGEVYQYWTYEYLSNYTDDVEPMEKRDEYDIKYKGKHIEIKYSALNKKRGEFQFNQIKPEYFDFILFVGFDAKNKKFYFEIESRDEYVENKRERVGSDDIFSKNGNEIQVGKSFFRFKNDFSFEDFDNYIITH